MLIALFATIMPGSSIIFSMDDNDIIALAYDEGIKMWRISDDGRNNEELTTLDIPSSGFRYVPRLKFSPDGNYLAAGDAEGNIHLWDTENPDDILKLPSLRKHEEEISSVAFSSDNKWFASLADDKSINLSSISEKGKFSLLRTLKPKNCNTYSLSFSHDNRYLILSGTKEKNFLITKFDLKNNLRQLPSKAIPFSCSTATFCSETAVISPDTNYFTLRSSDNDRPDGLNILDISDGLNRSDIKNTQFIPFDSSAAIIENWKWNTVSAVAFSDDSTQLAAGHTCGLLKILSRENGRFETTHEKKYQKNDSATIFDVAFSRDNNLLASIDDDNKISIWFPSPPKNNPHAMTLLQTIKTPRLRHSSSLAFRKKPKRKHHLNDPILQDEKIDLMEDLEITHLTGRKRKRDESTDDDEDEPLRKKQKNNTVHTKKTVW